MKYLEYDIFSVKNHNYRYQARDHLHVLNIEEKMITGPTLEIAITELYCSVELTTVNDELIVLSTLNIFLSITAFLGMNSTLQSCVLDSIEDLKMAIPNNFTKDERQQTAGELFYYSEELTRKIFGELIFLSVLNILLSVTTFLGNTLILVALPKENSLHPPSKLLFRNLAITDLCVGIIAEPLLVAYLMSLVKQRWDICYELDYAGLAIGAILCSVSLFTLTAISVDRLLALWLGLRYRRVATYIAYISVIVMWGLSVVAGAAIYSRSLDIVILDWSMFITISLCVVISSLCYTKVFVVLRRRKVRLEDSAFQGPTEVIKVPLNLARYRKAVYTALWVQVTLVVCYLPFGIATTIPEISLSVYLMTLTLLLLNSSLNPLLYCWKIREVRQAVKDTIRQLFSSSS